MNKILMILLLPLLFIFPSCDSGGDDDSADCPIEGTWGLTTFDYVFSEPECTSGEDGSADLSCLDVIVADDTTTWDTCDCDGEDPEDCTNTEDSDYTCDNPTTLDDGGSVTIDGDTATLIIIEPIEDFIFYEGGDYGEGCMVTSTLVFERE